MTHSLWLAQVDANRRVNAVRGIRAAIKALGGPVDGEDSPRGSIRGATGLLNAVLEHSAPMMIGTSTDPADIAAAAAALDTESGGAAVGVIDLTPEQALNWTPEPMPDDPEADDETPNVDGMSVQAFKTALVCLAAGDGKAMNAAVLAKLFEQSTGDAQFYRDVQAILNDTFTLRDDD